MKGLAFDRFAPCLSFVVASLLAGCGGGAQPPTVGAPDVTRNVGVAISYRVVSEFSSSPCDGYSPDAGLIAVNGTMYGTTLEGGGSDVGVIYSLTPSGTEQILYNFPKKSQYGGRYGYEPAAPLIEVNDRLYGLTQYGGTPGTRGYGTVFGFKIPGTAPTRPSSGKARRHCTSAGNVHIIHKFANGSDGANPVAALLNVNGVFYGTTPSGGTFGAGTVFRVTLPRTEHVLYSFGGSSGDGVQPYASLIDVNGTLYGTTLGGGAYGGGTIFSVSTSGSEQVLHSFGNGSDGVQPRASLLDVNGTLYGTTFEGGTRGDGTVYSFTPSGTEMVLYNFDDLHGQYPSSALIGMNGTLYGTTELGGYFSCYSNHCGTVYSVSTSGKEIVLHSFRGVLYGDGEYPNGSLVALHGTLYGTTGAGGTGAGTVFAVKP